MQPTPTPTPTPHVLGAAGPDPDAEILIVGGGPVGLTLACELERRGVSCRLIDRALTRARSSRATDVHARTLEIFAELGVIDRLLAAGKQVRGFNAYSEGRELSAIEFEGLETRYPFTLAVPQRETEAALEDRLVSLGGALERGLALVELRQHAGMARVVLARADGSLERARYRWVIACDGVHSSTRDLLGVPFEGHTYDQRYLVGDFDITWGRPDDRVHLFMSSQGFANVLALPGGQGDRPRVRVLCDLPADDPRPPSLETFRALMKQRARIHLRLSAPDGLASFRIQRRLVPRYRVGAVLFAGDAAHTCSPLLGQGMNTGIQDAHNLGWKLALVAQRKAEPALLDSYEAERRPVARAVLRDTHRMHVAATLRGRLPRRLRDLGVASSSRLKLARLEAGFRCSELRQRYPVGALDPTSLGARLDILELALAGARLPDVAIGGPAPWRLFELLDPTRHTLLLLGGQRSSALERARLDKLEAQARARFDDVVSVQRVFVGERRAGILDPGRRDHGGVVHQRLGATRPSAYLIRPDAYVAHRSLAIAPNAWPGQLERLFGRRSLDTRTPPSPYAWPTSISLAATR